MVREDIERVFALLKIYFPNSRKTGDKQLKSAWLRLLEPYSPETVQKAVTDALRGNVNFPDPQKIAVLCETAEPAPKELAAPVDCQRPYGDTAWMAPYIRKMAADISREDAEEIHASGGKSGSAEEKKRDLPPKPEDKPSPVPRMKLEAAVSLGTGRSREEVLAALKGDVIC